MAGHQEMRTSALAPKGDSHSAASWLLFRAIGALTGLRSEEISIRDQNGPGKQSETSFMIKKHRQG